MAKRHGRLVRAWVAGYRITPDIANIEESRQSETAQVTAVEEDDHSFVPGVRSHTATMHGFFDDTDAHVDDIMSEVASLGTENNDMLIIRANIQGGGGIGGEGGLPTGYSVMGSNSGPVTVDCAFLFSGAALPVHVSQAYGTTIIAGTSAASLNLSTWGTVNNGATFFFQTDSILGTVRIITYSGATNLAQTTALGTVDLTAALGVRGTAFTVAGVIAPFITHVWSLPGGTGTAAWVAAVGWRRN